MSTTRKHPSSYRDPSGFLFYHNDRLYRQVNKVYEDDFRKFQFNGLYQSLTEKHLLISHELITENFLQDNNWVATLQPRVVPMITYPSEWSFDMVKDAALLTLKINKEALAHGMVLKDASAYNVQWVEGRMIFIDSLSFETYDESKPWIAYRQFCEHFLAPLALMHYTQFPLHELWNAFPEGIPLALASKMLPFRTKFNLHLYLNVHLHASVAAGNKKQEKQSQFSSAKFNNLLRSLEEAVSSLSLNKSSGVWSHYYSEAEQRNNYMDLKKNIIEDWINGLPVKTAIDAGANEGFYAGLLAQKNIFTIAADLDHFSINQLYRAQREVNRSNLQPMIINLATPTPASGVNNRERLSFLDRVNADLVMALALIHHLSMGHNIPFESSAEMFSQMGSYLIIEWVPKSDEKVQLMLSHKKDIYTGYNQNEFVSAYTQRFDILDHAAIGSTGRILFLMKRK